MNPQRIVSRFLAAGVFRLPQSIPMNEVWKKAPEMLATLSVRHVELLDWLASGGDIAGGKGPNIGLNRGFGKTRTKGEVFPERHLMSELRAAGWVRWDSGAMPDFGNYHLTDSAEKVWTAKGRKSG